MRIALALPDDGMPRTLFWDRFLAALRANPRFTEDADQADLLFPCEDLALETNWPRYGRGETAFLRGRYDVDCWGKYLQRFVTLPRRVCVVNMHPFLRVPHLTRTLDHVFVADGCLASWERSLNPRTVSMPALPIVAGDNDPARQRFLLASFRGVVSHPCRDALAKLDDGRRILCQMVEQGNHAGRVDAEKGLGDINYQTLMSLSDFAFVPRGDALFSYRLLEALSFGAIPVVLSDGWVLPFDRTVDWHDIGLPYPENRIARLPEVLDTFDARRRDRMRQALTRAWDRYFCSLDRIVDTMLAELEHLLFDGRA